MFARPGWTSCTVDCLWRGSRAARLPVAGDVMTTLVKVHDPHRSIGDPISQRKDEARPVQTKDQLTELQHRVSVEGTWSVTQRGKGSSSGHTRALCSRPARRRRRSASFGRAGDEGGEKLVGINQQDENGQQAQAITPSTSVKSWSPMTTVSLTEVPICSRACRKPPAWASKPWGWRQCRAAD